MFKIRGCALRFANVVGPNQTHGVGYDFLKRLIKDRTKLKILGDGTQCKSYIYISDVLDSIELIISRMEDGIYFDVYNVATTDQITVTDIAKLTCDTIGLDSTVVDFIYSGGDRGWNGDVPKIILNSDKIRSLGWSNRLSSVEAVKTSLKGMFSNLSK
jgi:UDP-glucose 4-epimerase